MNTNTRRAATLTAALIIAGTLAACGDSGSGGADPAQAVVTDEIGDGVPVEEGIVTKATWDEPLDAPDGSGTFTVSLPVAELVDPDGAGVDFVDGVRIDYTYTNTTDRVVDVPEEFGGNVFSGTSGGSLGWGPEGERDYHLEVPAGRTAEWSEYWAVEDLGDVVVMVSPSVFSETEQSWALTFSNEAPEDEDW